MKRMALIATAVVFSAQSHLVHSQEAPPPSQLTSRGNIAWQASEDYRNAIDGCYHGKAGDAPQGPRFVACLKQLAGKESASLNAAYAGTIAALKSSPGQTAKLRESQRAWLQFQESNCGFAKTVAGNASEEFYFDCMLRSTIDRRVELRSLVGD